MRKLKPLPNRPSPRRADPAPAEQGLSWLMIGAIIAGNLVLIGLIYLAYRRFSNREVQAELDEFEQTLQQKETADSQAAEKTELTAPLADENDPLAALDALAEKAPDEGDMFPVDDEKKPKTDFPMDDLDGDEESKP